MNENTPRYTAYLVPHTHWDREWYQPFETFRTRLVDVIDRLLELMENDADYRRFTLDGQTILLRDYLRVRPEREAALRALIRAKRIRIGPWYVLADEFLVSPEALVRNLALGARDCEAFGDRLEVAYTPDSFGHVSQLPLLARQFGLDTVVFERGVGDEGEELRGEFTWRAADDSSEVFAKHLVATYSSAAALGHGDWELRDDYDAERAAQHASAALFGADGTELSYLPDWFRESLERIAGGAAAYATGDALLLLNGSDHLYPQRNVPEVTRDLNERMPHVTFEHADLEAFVRHARASAGSLARYQGEFRGSRYQHVLSGVLSARMYLKQANEVAQTRLEKYTEPLTALAWLRGRSYPAQLLSHAWETLLENHPHDSICGCSIDAVHDAMMTRFAAVHHIAASLERHAEEALIGTDGSAAVTVFNPHPFPVTRVVDASLTLPSPPAGPLTLLAADDRAVPAKVRLYEEPVAGRSDARETRVSLLLQAELPALGFAAYRLLEEGAGGAAPEAPDSPRRPPSDEGRHSIENDRLRLEVDSRGDLTLLDKVEGSRRPLRLRFEDSADAGDSYDFSPIDEPPRIFRELAAPPRLLEDGPLRSTLRLEYRAEVPARLREDRRAREGSVDLPLTLDLTLEAGRPSLGLRVHVDNRAEDHRLRLLVASGRSSDHVWADGHFDLVRRPVRPPGGAEWFQRPQGTNHQRRFVAVHDEQGGLAVLNHGLPEYEALPGPAGVDLAVTLLRCVGWLSRDDLSSRPQGAGPALPTPGAQCRGRHVFDLALLPLGGNDWRGPLLREADLFAAPPRARATAEAVSAPGPLLDLPAPLVMTALKRSETRPSLLVRIWNPSARSVEAHLALGFSPLEAHAVRFDETRLHPIEVVGPTVPLRLDSQEVLTVEFMMDPKEVVPPWHAG